MTFLFLLLAMLPLGDIDFDIDKDIVSSPQPAPVKQARYLMGTMCEIVAQPPAGDSTGQRTTAAINAAFVEIERLDAMLSNWKPDSELMQANRAAASPSSISSSGSGFSRPRAVASSELFARLRTALDVAARTGGLFDPTVAPLVRAYGFLPPCASPPCARQSIAGAKKKVGWRLVSLDANTRSIAFSRPGMEIDLGGIAKGYAADRAAANLRSAGIERALVSLGSSSLAAIGSAPIADAASAAGWPLILRGPEGEPTSISFYLFDGESLATSGTYEHRRRAGPGSVSRISFSHIIDPRTLRPVTAAVSVTVIATDGELADALAKPYLLLGTLSSPAALRLLAEFPQAGVILMAVRNGHRVVEISPAMRQRLEGKGPFTFHVAKAD